MEIELRDMGFANLVCFTCCSSSGSGCGRARLEGEQSLEPSVIIMFAVAPCALDSLPDPILRAAEAHGFRD